MSAKQKYLAVLIYAFLLSPRVTEAQTLLKLSAIAPGTENVQFVYNGDFQLQGPIQNNGHALPDGWTRQADMFAGPGTNLVPTDSGVAATAYLSNAAPVGSYQRTVTLQAATDYILSAYLWNMGDCANHVTTVLDMNDAPGEPQITLSYANANADQGYFVYRSFNTTNTGATGPVERIWLDRSYHVATLDYEKDVIETAIVDFARRVTS